MGTPLAIAERDRVEHQGMPTLDLHRAPVFRAGSRHQHRSGFAYGFAVYQLKYSRNLIFADGARMQRVFDTVVDRTHSRLVGGITAPFFACRAMGDIAPR